MRRRLQSQARAPDGEEDGGDGEDATATVQTVQPKLTRERYCCAMSGKHNAAGGGAVVAWCVLDIRTEKTQHLGIPAHLDPEAKDPAGIFHCRIFHLPQSLLVVLLPID